MHFLFRQHNLITVLFLFILMVALSTLNGLYSPIIPTDNFQIDLPFFSTSISGIVVYVICMLILLGQAFLINQIATNFKLARTSSLSVGLCFILLHFAGVADQLLLPVMLANFFIILSLSALFHCYDKKVPLGYVFNIGFWIGIAALIYKGNMGMIGWGLVGLLLVRTFDVKECILVLIGMLCPYFLVCTYLFVIADQSFSEMSIRFLNNFGWDWGASWLGTWYIFVGLIVFVYMLAILNVPQLVFKTTSKEKKFFSVLFIQPIFSVLGVFAVHPIESSHFVNLIPSCAILLGVLCLTFKRAIIAELLIFLVCCLFFVELFII